MKYAVGVIADIVGSREMPDRPAAQRAITQVFDKVEAAVPAQRAAWATVGDEFQLITATWQDAIRITLRMHTLLPDDTQLRFGIGAGEINTIEEGQTGPIQDGSAWLHARAAIEAVEQRQQHRADVFSGFQCDDVEFAVAVNAQLTLADHIVARMKARERRLCGALLLGSTQQEAAREENISQAAVSQTLHRSGAMAVLEADAMLAT